MCVCACVCGQCVVTCEIRLLREAFPLTKKKKIEKKSQRSGYGAVCVVRVINHIPFLCADSSSWQRIWFWPLKSRHVVERRLRDLSLSMPLKENVWMGLLIRKQLEAIPHRHEISMHLLWKSQTDWRRCEAGSVPITQWAKCSEWLTMIKCKRQC